MNKQKFGYRVPTPPGAVETAALGASASPSARFTDNDIGKAVKLAALDNYVLVADGDDIEGVVNSIEIGLVNNGFSYGGVRNRFYEHEAIVTGTALAVNATVVAAAQAALGTVNNADKLPRVKAGAGVLFKWRVKSLLAGTGQVGQKILIAPISVG